MDEAAPRDEILAQAMRWLARREYSVWELERRLRGKGHEPDKIAEVLADLTARALVDDRRFAESLVRSRVERGYGPVKMEQELRAKGVDETLVAEVLADDGGRWLEHLHEVWRKRFGAAPGSYREWTGQARKLQSRGFTAEQIRRVVPDIDPGDEVDG